MKLKIPPVIVMFLALGIIFGVYHLFPQITYQFSFQKTISRVFLGLGVAISFWGIIAFRKKDTTVDPRFPDKASSLVDSGIYKYTRNPMYLGMACVLLGGIIRIGNPAALLGLVFFYWYINQFQIKPEEEALRKVFGKQYEDYCAMVRRWI